jgi:uncharacterized membrane-anchored protein YhcB (DUF1043 family)
MGMASMNWTDIIKFLISISGLSTIIIYIVKKLVDKSLDAGIEKYKGNLNLELESHKAELAKVNTEHQFKYSKLYEQRADKIRELYTMLYELEQKLKFLTSLFQGSEWSTDKERDEAVRNQVLSLEEALELNRIYFNDGLCSKIQSIIEQSRAIQNQIFGAKLIQKRHDDLIATNRGQAIVDPHEPVNKWRDAGFLVEIEINSARLELANEFRSMIGVV